MSDEKKETKCCGCCKGAKKELNNEDLDKVTGGSEKEGLGKTAHLVNGQYICTDWENKTFHCNNNKTVNNVANVCTCPGKTDGRCCRIFGDNCTCKTWNKIYHECMFS